MTLRLHLNENNAGCSPAVLAAIHQMGREDIGRYPDLPAATARVALHFGVGAAEVLLTNGLDDGVYTMAMQACARGGPCGAIIIDPAFDSYTTAVDTAGGHVTRIAPRHDFSLPVAEVLEAIAPDTRLVFVNRPNNPTGQPVDAGVIDRIAEAMTQGTVFVDEAYIDFAGRTILGTPPGRHPNVVVGRTFSKVYGLAGLRIGALVGRPEVIAPIRARQPIFSVNSIAVVALRAALDDREYDETSIAASTAAREAVYTWCNRHGVPCWRSEANFVLIRVGARASEIARQLSVRGVFVRDVSAAPGCAGCIRLSATRLAEVELGLNALEHELRPVRRG